MPAERIQPKGLPTPPAYSHVVKVGNTVYISGQVPQDESGAVVGAGDFAAQAVQVFENLKKALASVGGDLTHMVKITTFITDPRFREPLMPIRTEYMKPPLPASTLVVVAGLALPEYLIEIEAIAVIE